MGYMQVRSTQWTVVRRFGGIGISLCAAGLIAGVSAAGALVEADPSADHEDDIALEIRTAVGPSPRAVSTAIADSPCVMVGADSVSIPQDPATCELVPPAGVTIATPPVGAECVWMDEGVLVAGGCDVVPLGGADLVTALLDAGVATSCGCSGTVLAGQIELVVSGVPGPDVTGPGVDVWLEVRTSDDTELGTRVGNGALIVDALAGQSVTAVLLAGSDRADGYEVGRLSFTVVAVAPTGQPESQTPAQRPVTGVFVPSTVIPRGGEVLPAGVMGPAAPEGLIIPGAAAFPLVSGTPGGSGGSPSGSTVPVPDLPTVVLNEDDDDELVVIIDDGSGDGDGDDGDSGNGGGGDGDSGEGSNGGGGDTFLNGDGVLTTRVVPPTSGVDFEVIIDREAEHRENRFLHLGASWPTDTLTLDLRLDNGTTLGDALSVEEQAFLYTFAGRIRFVSETPVDFGALDPDSLWLDVSGTAVILSTYDYLDDGVLRFDDTNVDLDWQGNVSHGIVDLGGGDDTASLGHLTSSTIAAGDGNDSITARGGHGQYWGRAEFTEDRNAVVLGGDGDDTAELDFGTFIGGRGDDTVRFQGHGANNDGVHRAIIGAGEDTVDADGEVIEVHVESGMPIDVSVGFDEDTEGWSTIITSDGDRLLNPNGSDDITELILGGVADDSVVVDARFGTETNGGMEIDSGLGADAIAFISSRGRQVDQSGDWVERDDLVEERPFELQAGLDNDRVTVDAVYEVEWDRFVRDVRDITSHQLPDEFDVYEFAYWGAEAELQPAEYLKWVLPSTGAIDGGAGDGDTIVLNVLNPLPENTVLGVGDLEDTVDVGTVLGFENLEIVAEWIPVPDDPPASPTSPGVSGEDHGGSGAHYTGYNSNAPDLNDGWTYRFRVKAAGPTAVEYANDPTARNEAFVDVGELNDDGEFIFRGRRRIFQWADTRTSIVVENPDRIAFRNPSDQNIAFELFFTDMTTVDPQTGVTHEVTSTWGLDPGEVRLGSAPDLGPGMNEPTPPASSSPPTGGGSPSITDLPLWNGASRGTGSGSGGTSWTEFNQRLEDVSGGADITPSDRFDWLVRHTGIEAWGDTRDRVLFDGEALYLESNEQRAAHEPTWRESANHPLLLTPRNFENLADRGLTGATLRNQHDEPLTFRVTHWNDTKEVVTLQPGEGWEMAYPAERHAAVVGGETLLAGDTMILADLPGTDFAPRLMSPDADVRVVGPIDLGDRTENVVSIEGGSRVIEWQTPETGLPQDYGSGAFTFAPHKDQKVSVALDESGGFKALTTAVDGFGGTKLLRAELNGTNFEYVITDVLPDDYEPGDVLDARPLHVTTDIGSWTGDLGEIFDPVDVLWREQSDFDDFRSFVADISLLDDPDLQNAARTRAYGRTDAEGLLQQAVGGSSWFTTEEIDSIDRLDIGAGISLLGDPENMDLFAARQHEAAHRGNIEFVRENPPGPGVDQLAIQGSLPTRNQVVGQVEHRPPLDNMLNELHVATAMFDSPVRDWIGDDLDETVDTVMDLTWSNRDELVSNVERQFETALVDITHPDVLAITGAYQGVSITVALPLDKNATDPFRRLLPSGKPPLIVASVNQDSPLRSSARFSFPAIGPVQTGTELSVILNTGNGQVTAMAKLVTAVNFASPFLHRGGYYAGAFSLNGPANDVNHTQEELEDNPYLGGISGFNTNIVSNPIARRIGTGLALHGVGTVGSALAGPVILGDFANGPAPDLSLLTAGGLSAFAANILLHGNFDVAYGWGHPNLYTETYSAEDEFRIRIGQADFVWDEGLRFIPDSPDAARPPSS